MTIISSSDLPLIEQLSVQCSVFPFIQSRVLSLFKVFLNQPHISDFDFDDFQSCFNAFSCIFIRDDAVNYAFRFVFDEFTKIKSAELAQSLEVSAPPIEVQATTQQHCQTCKHYHDDVCIDGVCTYCKDDEPVSDEPIPYPPVDITDIVQPHVIPVNLKG